MTADWLWLIVGTLIGTVVAWWMTTARMSERIISAADTALTHEQRQRFLLALLMQTHGGRKYIEKHRINAAEPDAELIRWATDVIMNAAHGRKCTHAGKGLAGCTECDPRARKNKQDVSTN